MSEKSLETAFVKWVRSVGGEAIKGPAYQYKGIPDRIALLPHGGTVYVEFKASELCDLAPLQKYWRQLILNSDYNRYFVIDNKETLGYTIDRCKLLMQLGAEEQIQFASHINASDKFTPEDFPNNTILHVINSHTLSTLPLIPTDTTSDISSNPSYVKILYNTELSVGSLFYDTERGVVNIIKTVTPQGANVTYTYELYYQYRNQTSATPLKFIL